LSSVAICSSFLALMNVIISLCSQLGCHGFYECNSMLIESRFQSFFLLLPYFFVNSLTLIYEFGHKNMLLNSCISLFCNLKITLKSRMCNWFKNER
jgi:hypothetical protein